MLVESLRVLADILVTGTYAAMLAHIWFETMGDASLREMLARREKRYTEALKKEDELMRL